MAKGKRLGAFIAAAVLILSIGAFLAGRSGLLRSGAAGPGPRAAPVTQGAAGASGSLAGEWDLTVRGLGYEMDYGLRIEETAGGLSAIQVSPRSGEHAFKSISWKDGVLRMEIDREYPGIAAVTVEYEGTLADGTLSGKVTAKGYDGTSGTWTARRKRRAESKEGPR